MYVVIDDEYPETDQERGGPQNPRAALARFFADQRSSLRSQNAAEYREAPPVTETGMLVREEGAAVRAVGVARKVGDSWQLEHYEACVELVKGAEREAVSEKGPATTGMKVVLVPGLGLALLVGFRRRLRGTALLFAITAVVALGLQAVPVQAHCAGGDCGDDWYGPEWKADHHTGLNITWRFTSNFPSGAKRDRVVDAFSKWNALGQKMRFDHLSEVPDYTYDLCDSPHHGIHWHDISPIARTEKCVHDRAFTTDDVLHGFNMTFDSSRIEWFGWDDESLIGSGDLDFESIAAHEAGHATGFSGMYADGHFDPNGDLCPTSSARHTMCPEAVWGKTWMRSLETHDIHTFQNAYPDA